MFLFIFLMIMPPVSLFIYALAKNLLVGFLLTAYRVLTSLDFQHLLTSLGLNHARFLISTAMITVRTSLMALIPTRAITMILLRTIAPLVTIFVLDFDLRAFFVLDFDLIVVIILFFDLGAFFDFDHFFNRQQLIFSQAA
jgi:hypothetical protein